MKNPTIYSQLAASISYPLEGYVAAVEACDSDLKKEYPQAASYFAETARFVANADVTRLEEAYTATFDVNAVCHLDVGYQLFGEDYKRGALLVELSRVQREANSPVGTELADHLPSLLRLLPRMTNPEEREELARRLLLPAIEKMIASFPEGSENIYRSALRSVACVLEADFGALIEFPEQPDYSAQVEEAMNV